MSDCDYLCKLIIFGDDGVGKTTLETHLDPVFGPLIDSLFSTEFTIGVSFQKLIVELKGFRILFQIWLMSNEERFTKIPEFRMQLTGSKGAILLYDITNPYLV